jgi:hypothetical protein
MLRHRRVGKFKRLSMHTFLQDFSSVESGVKAFTPKSNFLYIREFYKSAN